MGEAWVRFRSGMGDLLVDAIRLPEVPAPGERVLFAGDEIEVADVPPVRRVERLDVGERGLTAEVATVVAMKRPGPKL
jgi:hypothetical protein